MPPRPETAVAAVAAVSGSSSPRITPRGEFDALFGIRVPHDGSVSCGRNPSHGPVEAQHSTGGMNGFGEMISLMVSDNSWADDYGGRRSVHEGVRKAGGHEEPGGCVASSAMITAQRTARQRNGLSCRSLGVLSGARRERGVHARDVPVLRAPVSSEQLCSPPPKARYAIDSVNLGATSSVPWLDFPAFLLATTQRKRSLLHRCSMNLEVHSSQNHHP